MVQLKTNEVARLMRSISSNLVDNHLTHQEKSATLQQLKVHGRSVEGSEAIYCTDGIRILSQVAISDTDKPCSQEALRVLANALFLDASMREVVIDARYMEQFSDLYESDDLDDQFLLARILFFTTYAAKKERVEKLVDEHHLADNVSRALRNTSTKLSTSHNDTMESPMFNMALSETTKLMFGVKSKLFDRDNLFLGDAQSLFTIMTKMPPGQGPLEAPLKDVISALSGLELEQGLQSRLEENTDIMPRTLMLLDHWTSAITSRHEDVGDFEEGGAPLIKLLLDTARFGNATTRAELKKQLLPSEAERDKPLGQGNSLAARLIQITATPAAPHTRNLISALLFDLSDNDPATFVKNVGYGNAAGYLMSQGIAAPEGSMNVSATQGEPVNPITGQKLSREQFEDLPEMTDEEKEREAERLFVLFDRLKQTGVIDVENPVRKAMEEGRFEELD